VRLLTVHPGAFYATGDVYRGFVRELRRQGHACLEYLLDARIDDANDYYRYVYRRDKLGTPPSALILTHAAIHIVPQALYHRVDGVVVFSGMLTHPDVFVLLKRAGIPTALVLSESPYDDAQQARILAHRDAGQPVVDVAFTNERASLDFLGRFHPAVHYLPHAYDAAAIEEVGPPLDPCDVLFVGTLFEERMELLGAVDWAGIDLALRGNLKLLPGRHRLRRFVRGGVMTNAEALRHYRGAKLVLNPYRTSRGYGVGVAKVRRAESLNPRALELAALGAIGLSEPRAEVREVFGDLATTYTDAASLGALIRELLADEGRRDALREQLPRAVSAHTYEHRAKELIARIAASWSPRATIRKAV
jgi:glycosyltransferase involved in cell wall biosynthesis